MSESQSLIRRTGYAMVCSRDGSYYRIEAAEYTRVLDAWKRGTAFIDTIGCFGQPVSIKLASIEAVTLWMPNQIAAEIADKRASDREDEQADAFGN